jgi:hypothetical protein
VRYRVKNAPFRTSVCHCKACQRRTGSAFGVGIYFKDEDFELLRGELKPYSFRSDESGPLVAHGVLHQLRHHGDLDRGSLSPAGAASPAAPSTTRAG